MKQLFIILTCFSALFCVFSCKNQEKELNKEMNELLKNTDPEFSTKEKAIFFKELRNNDIQANVDFTIDKRGAMQMGCSFSFFNYGGDISLFKGYIDDGYVNTLGTIVGSAVIEDAESIQINNRYHNDKYGDWAIVSIETGLNGINDIFLTPLALKELEEGDKENLILVVFADNDGQKIMKVIFHGTHVESLIIDKFVNNIVNNSSGFSMSGLITGPGQFWKDAPHI